PFRQQPQSAATEAKQPEGPIAEVELLPGRLVARVYHQDFGQPGQPLPCWTYVTDGLRTQGQPEVAFTLRRRHHEAPSAFPSDPLQWLTDLHARVVQGYRFEPGDYSKFAYPQGFLG